MGHYEWPPFSLIRSAYKNRPAAAGFSRGCFVAYDMRAPILAAFRQKGKS
jgi:hypothetical protein